MTERYYPNAERNHTMVCRSAPLSQAGAADMAHYLVVAAGSECGKKIEIGLAPIRLGRGPDNELPLADPFVSSRHCSVCFEDGQTWVTDEGSTNGSFIAGEQVKGRRVWPMAVALQIGKQILRHEYRRRAEVQDTDELARELRHAAGYVQTLLPPPLAGGPVAASWHFQPSAELGGDIFDYFWLDAGRFVFYLLDVSGHGVGAALHSVSLFSLLRQKSLPGIDLAQPAQVLQALNHAFPMERYGSMYFTLWYGIYHAPANRLDFASAGHPPALMFGAGGHSLGALSCDNPPLGMVAGVKFEEKTVMPGAPFHLYLYSDGVYEFTTREGELWDRAGFARWLLESLGAGGGQPDRLFQALRAETKAGRFDDDFSLLRLDFLG